MNPNSMSALNRVAKTILVSVFLIQIAFSAFSQFDYGLRAGGQMVTLHSYDQGWANDYSWRPSYHGGLFFTYQFSKKFSAVADLLYSEKGYRIEGMYQDYNVHLNYLSVPVMAQYHLNSNFSFQL